MNILLTYSKFRDVYIETYPGLVVYASKFVRKDKAEDIVHDCFMALWDKRKYLVIRGDIRYYLFRSVHNACLNYIKREAVRNRYIDDNLRLAVEYYDTHMETTFDILYRKDLFKELMDAVASLPDKTAEVFRLSFFSELKREEISKAKGISVRTVDAHLYKALKVIRKYLTNALKDNAK